MPETINHTVNAVKELVALFRVERMVYLIITMLSLLILVGTALWMIFNSSDQDETIAAMGLFTSSGGIMYSTGRLLKMWSEAMQLVQKAIEQKNGQ